MVKPQGWGHSDISYIRRLVSFLGFKSLNFNAFLGEGGFRKMNIFEV